TEGVELRAWQDDPNLDRALRRKCKALQALILPANLAKLDARTENKTGRSAMDTTARLPAGNERTIGAIRSIQPKPTIKTDLGLTKRRFGVKIREHFQLVIEPPR